MKKSLASLALALVVANGVQAQGVVQFRNYYGVGDSNTVPVYDAAGNLLSGPAYLADLFYGTNGTPVNALTDAGKAIPFFTGAGAGYFIGGDVRVPYSENMVFQVRVWESAAGSSWQAATGGALLDGSSVTDSSVYVQNGGIQWGFSNPFIFTPDVPPGPSTPLSGLQSFSLTVVPEPSTWALLLCGAASFAIRSWRNRVK
jgi:hypothetical protein